MSRYQFRVKRDRSPIERHDRRLGDGRIHQNDAVIEDRSDIARSLPSPRKDLLQHFDPADVVIVPADETFKPYAFAVEKLLINSGLHTIVDVLRNGSIFSEATDHWSHRGALFVIQIDEQNEQHYSVTLVVCKHGKVLRVHRNMGVDDAIREIQIGADEIFLEQFIDKARPSITITSQSQLNQMYTPRSIAFLMHLIADNRYVSLSELTSVVSHLENRRQALAKEEGKIAEPVTSALTTKAPTLLSEPELENSSAQRVSQMNWTQLSSSAQECLLTTALPHLQSLPTPPSIKKHDTAILMTTPPHVQSGENNLGKTKANPYRALSSAFPVNPPSPTTYSPSFNTLSSSFSQMP